MSSMYINDIVGTGTYADPDTDVKAQAIATDLAIALGTVSGLTYNNLTAAWTRTTDAGGSRHVCAQVDGFVYTGKEFLSDAEVQTLGAAVKSAILGRSGVTSVGTINFDLLISALAWRNTPTNRELVLPAVLDVDQISNLANTPAGVQTRIGSLDNVDLGAYVATGNAYFFVTLRGPFNPGTPTVDLTLYNETDAAVVKTLVATPSNGDWTTYTSTSFTRTSGAKQYSLWAQANIPDAPDVEMPVEIRNAGIKLTFL